MASGRRSSSGARSFPGFQDPAPRLRQAQADGRRRPRSGAANDGARTLLGLVPPQGVDLAECLIELEGPRGKMRIQWKGANPPELAGLSSVLWESA